MRTQDGSPGADPRALHRALALVAPQASTHARQRALAILAAVAIGVAISACSSDGAIGPSAASLARARVESLGAPEINARYFAGRTDSLRVRGTVGRLMSAQG